MRIHNIRCDLMHSEYLDVDDVLVQDQWVVKPICWYGDSVYPAFAGTIMEINEDANHIFSMSINHGNTYVSTYGNLDRVYVNQYDIVYRNTPLGDAVDNILYFNVENRHGKIPNLFNEHGLNNCEIVHYYGPNCGCGHHRFQHHHNMCPITILPTEPDGVVYDYIYTKTELRSEPHKHSALVTDLFRGTMISWNNRVDKIISEGKEWIYITTENGEHGYIPIQYLSSSNRW